MENSNLQGFTCYNFKKDVARSPLGVEHKCLILESDPTPDYYAKAHFPPNKRSKNLHLFLPIKKSINCFQDVVLRSIYSLNSDKNIKLPVTAGQIIFKNENRQCIRVASSGVEHLPMIIENLSALGITFMKDTKIEMYQSTIYYKKYTSFTELEEGVYQDKNNEFRYFFAISDHIDLEKFLEGTKIMKDNCNYHMFDSFLSYIFIDNRVQDFIGVYSEHCAKNRFGELKQQIKNIFDKDISK